MSKSYQPDTNTEDDDSDDEAPKLIQVSTEAIVAVAVEENPASRFTRKSNGTKPIDNGNDDDKTDTRACPVTILSGFLGSGKTTLIQYILQNPDHGKKIAVIENEFGDGLAIESLIARDGIDPGSGSLQDLIELPNGCVCCTVKDTLVETLELLIAKRADLDYILIEASGMADPGPIASVFWLDEALESRLKLDGIVTLVDGKHLLGQLEATEEAARQIAYADRIVLNKVDLLLDKNNKNNNNTSRKSNGRQSDMALPTLAAVEGALRAIHPTAPILKTSFSKIPNLDWILDADCFSGFEHLEEIHTGFDENDKAEAGETEADTDHHHDHHHDHGDDCSECDHEESADHHHDDHGHDHHNDGHDNHHNDDHHNGDRHDKHKHHKKHHKHHEHTHTSSITSISLEYPGSVDVRKLNAWLADILWPDQDQTDTVLTAMLRKQEEERNAKAAALANVTATTPYTSSGGHASSTHNSNMQQQQQIFRIKGIVSILSSEDYEMNNSDVVFDSEELDPRRFIVQAVHDLWDIQPVTSLDLYWDEDEARTGKVVVIGKFLQHQSLRDGFRKCFVV